MNNKHSSKQAGLVTVEFALIGAVFFLVLFAIIEMGRLLFTWNVLDEVTRRAARLAAVCPMDQVDNVKQRAVFNSTILAKLKPANIEIVYLKSSLDPTDPATAVEDVRFVRASIAQGDDGYEYKMLIPGLSIAPFNTSSFTTTLPSESLGITPAGSWDVQCTGV